MKGSGKVRSRKKIHNRQFGGLGIPPAFSQLFENGNPTLDDVLKLGSDLGGDTFNRAVAADDPNIILGDVMKTSSFQGAMQANPLKSQEQIDKEIEAQMGMYRQDQQRRASATGASMFSGPDPVAEQRYREQLEHKYARENKNQINSNKITGSMDLVNTGMDFVNSSQLFNMFDMWSGQKGGKPTTQMGWKEALALVDEDSKFIKGLKNDAAGKEYVSAILADMGFSQEFGGDGTENTPDLIKKYKEIHGLNMSPKKGANNEIDSGFLDFLSGHYKEFSLAAWGLDPGELKKMQLGGKAALGYSDESPYKFLPAIEIPGNNITMAQTGMPLMGIPDVGQPKVMAPYSGNHNFPGASKVREVPIKQKGGSLTKEEKSVFEEWRKSLPKNLQTESKDYDLVEAWRGGLEPVLVEGEWHLASRNPETGQLLKSPNHPTYDQMIEGEIKEGYVPSMDVLSGKMKSFPMTKKRKGGRIIKKLPIYQQGGAEGQEAPAPPVGVQLEEGEVFVTPNLDIIDTNAVEKHKDMKKDLVTDILKDEYVFSAHPSMKVTKKRLEDISFGMEPVLYKEGEVADIPKEMTAADILEDKEKDIIIADYVKRVRKKYPTLDNEDDVFARKDNAGNKKSRTPLIAAAVLVNEEKRTKGNEPMSGFVSNFENPFDTDYTAEAGVDQTPNQHAVTGAAAPSKGPVVSEDPVPKGQFGLDAIGQVANFASSLVGLFTAGANGRTARRALEADRPQIENLARTQGRYSDMSYGAQAAGLIGQDPTVSAPQYDSTQMDARVRSTPRNYFDMAAARIATGNKSYMDSLFENTDSFGDAVNAYTPAHVAGISAMADLGAQQIDRDIALENQYRDQKQGFNDRQILADNTATNATRTNANQLTGALGQVAGAGISSRGRIAAERINGLRQNSLNQAQSKIDAGNAMTGAIQNVGAAAANTGYYLQQSIDANKAGTDLGGAGVNNNIDFRSIGAPGVGTAAGAGPLGNLTPAQKEAILKELLSEYVNGSPFK